MNIQSNIAQVQYILLSIGTGRENLMCLVAKDDFFMSRRHTIHGAET